MSSNWYSAFDGFDCDAVLASFFNIFFFYCQSNPMLTFSVSGPAAITTEIDAVPRCHDLESSVPLGLLIPPQPFAAQGLNRMSMWPIPLTYLAAAVQTLNVPNVSSFSQDHVLVVLYFMRTSFFAAHFPRHSVVVV